MEVGRPRVLSRHLPHLYQSRAGECLRGLGEGGVRRGDGLSAVHLTPKTDPGVSSPWRELCITLWDVDGVNGKEYHSPPCRQPKFGEPLERYLEMMHVPIIQFCNEGSKLGSVKANVGGIYYMPWDSGEYCQKGRCALRACGKCYVAKLISYIQCYSMYHFLRLIVHDSCHGDYS